MRLGVLISGSGTNLQAILDAIAAGELHATVEIVISSRPDAYGLERAAAAGVQTAALSKEAYADPMSADAAIAALLKERDVDLVVMAGYMRKLTAVMLEAYPDKIVNLHPALLPSFPGAHGIADALEHGVKVTGVTVHFANAIYDDGPIIAQVAVPIEEGDTETSLATRIHEAEHMIYPQVLELFAQDRVSIVGGAHGRRVVRILQG